MVKLKTFCVEKLERSNRVSSSRNLEFISPNASQRAVEISKLQSRPTLSKIKLNTSEKIYRASAFSSPENFVNSPSDEKDQLLLPMINSD